MEGQQWYIKKEIGNRVYIGKIQWDGKWQNRVQERYVEG